MQTQSHTCTHTFTYTYTILPGARTFQVVTWRCHGTTSHDQPLLRYHTSPPFYCLPNFNLTQLQPPVFAPEEMIPVPTGLFIPFPLLTLKHLLISSRLLLPISHLHLTLQFPGSSALSTLCAPFLVLPQRWLKFLPSCSASASFGVAEKPPPSPRGFSRVTGSASTGTEAEADAWMLPWLQLVK